MELFSELIKSHDQTVVEVIENLSGRFWKLLDCPQFIVGHNKLDIVLFLGVIISLSFQIYSFSFSAWRDNNGLIHDVDVTSVKQVKDSSFQLFICFILLSLLLK